MANAGYERDAKALAERMEALFAKYDYVVGPSASCVVFVKEGYPRLLKRLPRTRLHRFPHLGDLRIRTRRRKPTSLPARFRTR